MATNNIIEILYNNFDRINEEDLVLDKFFIEQEGEMIPIAQGLNGKYGHIFDNVKKLSKSKTKFVMTFQDTMIKASTELSGSAVKILWYLISKMQYKNCVFNVKYVDMQIQFKMSYSTITKAIKELKEAKYLKIDGKRTNQVYHISPAICWKGSVYSMYEKLKMFVDEEENR